MAIITAEYHKEPIEGVTEKNLYGHNISYKKTYEGCVLATRERNFYDDSDFYAVVWDEAEQRIKEVEYATTRFPTYDNGASVDATPEVLEKAAAFIEQQHLNDIRAGNIWQAKSLVVGKTVKVIKGRKAPIGATGKIFWMGKVNYGYSKWTEQTKIGISPSGELVNGKYNDAIWTYANNVEVIDWEQCLWTEDDMITRAKERRNDYAYMSKRASAAMGCIAM